MKDYARMNAEQQAAYNEGLLDAMDRLQVMIEAIEKEGLSFTLAAFRAAKNEISILRDAQINADPQ